jgi:hypothetical protein
MKRIIASVCALISPLVIAEQQEEGSVSPDENAYVVTDKKNTKKIRKGYVEGQKPHLQDFASYNDFLKAMYLYKKFEEDTIRPKVTIALPNQKNPEYTPIEGNKDITIWGEELPSEYVILGE